MRIAIVSTSALAVPPKAYGGTELFVHDLARELVDRGHDVTVYATGDSKPAGKLRSCFREAVWPPDPHAALAHAVFAWRDIADARPKFDLVHVNCPAAFAAAAVSGAAPAVMTLHDARIDAAVHLYAEAPEITLVAISQRQADLVPELGVSHVIHHGVDPRRYPTGDGGGGYCAFVGRLAPEKGPAEAIEAARAARVPIRLAGPNGNYMPFFEREIAPRLGDDATFVGELTHRPKVELLSRARALLFPIQWEEPFGLVMIESMLVGTPVVSFRGGSASEVVDDGVTGFLVKDTKEMAVALRAASRLDRRRVRARALERWSSARMAREYETLYEEILFSNQKAAYRLAL